MITMLSTITRSVTLPSSAYAASVLSRSLVGIISQRTLTTTTKTRPNDINHGGTNHRCLTSGVYKIPDRYQLTVLTPTFPYLDDAFNICAKAFVDEPASIHLEEDRNLRLKGWEQFTNHFVDECSSNGMSVACMDRENDDKIVATTILRDFALDLPPLLKRCIEEWKDPDFASSQCQYAFLGPLLEVLVDVDNKYMTKVHPNGIKPGSVVDLWMLGTHPDYRQQGLLTACLGKALALARNHGYSEAVAECTGHYSASAMRQLGGKPVAHTDYHTFHSSDGQVGWQVDPPHSKLEILSCDFGSIFQDIDSAS